MARFGAGSWALPERRPATGPAPCTWPPAAASQEASEEEGEKTKKKTRRHPLREATTASQTAPGKKVSASAGTGAASWPRWRRADHDQTRAARGQVKSAARPPVISDEGGRLDKRLLDSLRSRLQFFSMGALRGWNK